MDHTASCGGHTVLFCGAIPQSNYSQFKRSLAVFIQEKERAKTTGEKGFQRTPAFILSAVLHAMDLVNGMEESIPNLPRGGFTDVGPHTGGRARDTATPLVREVIKVRQVLYF